MRRPFALVQDEGLARYGTVPRALLEHARSGQVIGIAFACMLNRRGYIVNSASEAFRNPTSSRGMVHAVDDRLAERIRGGNP